MNKGFYGGRSGEVAGQDNHIKVIIADDHVLFRRGLRSLLEEDGQIEVIGEAGNGLELLNQLQEHQPDLVLLDLNMPEMDGLEVIRALRTHHPQVRSLVLSGFYERQHFLAAVEEGAAGYMLKSAAPPLVLSAIRTIADGGTWIQRELTAHLCQEVSRRGREAELPPSLLTRRELEILKLVASGLANADIATQLYLSEQTVKAHVSNILRKLQLKDRVQATRYAIRHLLVEA